MAVDQGRIVAVGREQVPPSSGPPRRVREIDLGRVAVLPALVNAHTHLELSWMRGRLSTADSFPDWIRQLITLRGSQPDPAGPLIRSAIEQGIQEARRAGTVLVGDIGNTLASVEPLRASELRGIVFREVIGFSPPDPDKLVRDIESEIDAVGDGDTVRLSLAAHAPYSVAPLVFRAIRDGLARRPFRPCSIHLAESRDELEFLLDAHGAWRALLEDVGAWEPSWKPPGCGPLEYLERMGFISERLLVVHGVHLTASELTRLARAGATLVTCPRGNLATRAGTPPIAAFHRSGVRVAIGTDSLASVDDLNVFQELAALRRLAPEVPARTLLTWATENGAQALGFARDYGAIESGRRAALLAVALPARVGDVEEYLLSGIDPAHVSWVETAH